MSFESDSQTSLSQRDLSQDDGSSLNSGNSSVDLPPPVDDKERLALLDSAINWIKEELAGMRDRDKDILKELLQAHSSIQDIHLQQKQALEVEHEFENRKSFGSMDSVDESDQTSNHSSNRSLERTLVSSHTSVHVGVNRPPITRYSVDKIALQDDKKNADDDLLRSFLGEENIEKLTYFSNSSHISVDSEDGVSPSLVQDRNKINSSQSMAELKVHAKKEGRSSVAFEMQMLRQKLQEEAKEELAAFDKKFDSPTHSSFLEVERTSYRHSILNRMEEILNPGNHGNHDGSSGNHIRQSSEPVVLENMYWSNSNGNTSNEYGNPPPVQPRLSQPGFHSFRLPSHHHSSQLNRTGSGFGKTHSSERHSVTMGQQTHYDTTVVGKRRSRPSSRTSTLERKHPLQYSVESLNGEVGTTEHVYNGEMNGFDVDKPEHKSITNRRGPGSSNGVGNMDPSNHKPKQTSFRGMQHQPSPLSRKDSGSPEIYPELSPVTSPSRLNYKIDPYMTSSEAIEQMEQYSNGKSEEAFVYTPYSEAKKQFNHSSSAPLKRRNKIKGSDKTWL